MRGAVRDGGRGRVHRAGDEGQRGKDVQREGERGEEVFGAVDLESCFEGLCGSECVGLGGKEAEDRASRVEWGGGAGLLLLLATGARAVALCFASSGAGGGVVVIIYTIFIS